jgi:5'-methylthioadenosine phosphorylase
LAAVHDVAEAETGDVATRAEEGAQAVAPEEKERCERAAMEGPLADLGGKVRDLWEGYESRESPRARFVKDADLLDAYLQALVYERDGRYDPDAENAAFEAYDDFNEFLATAKPRLSTERGRELFEAVRERYEAAKAERWTPGLRSGPRHRGPRGSVCLSWPRRVPRQINVTAARWGSMLGIIGGSGIYEALGFEDSHEERMRTPFGDPSAPLEVGELAGTEVAFLPRHGRDHQYDPTNVPYRANVHALKQVGVDRVLATNAVGSLRESLSPRTLVVPDQLFDRTRDRPRSFFGDGVVVHVSMADPYCPDLSKRLLECAGATDADVVDGGTYVCIEGPQFSTRAESECYRDRGYDVIGMTTVPEAQLAREAELCYAALTGVTDYDVWHDEEEVSLETVLDHAAANEGSMSDVLGALLRSLDEGRDCDCQHALRGAINTPADAIDRETREKVSLLVDDYR